MQPFFAYYGSKYSLARRYAAPHHPVVIEPFAGSACYSVSHDVPRATLLDTDPIICGIWHYSIHASSQEIMRLPDLPVGDSVHNHPLPQEAKWLIGHWLNFGPKCMATSTSRSLWRLAIRERIARQVHRIRDWTIKQASYDTAPDTSATWFVDPPYEVAGKWYRHPFTEYDQLAGWCQNRLGQTIVC